LHLGDGQTTGSVLAVGAHQKNTIAMLQHGEAFVSQHIGDLETAPAFAAFVHVIDEFSDIYAFKPSVAVCDAHPDYLSTSYAEATARVKGLPLAAVQHHYAHVLACMADNDVHGRVLGVAWDAQATVLMAQFGVASFCVSPRMDSSGWPTCARSACPAASAR
jgi:hydrogenase maturation protein HypF